MQRPPIMAVPLDRSHSTWRLNRLVPQALSANRWENVGNQKIMIWNFPKNVNVPAGARTRARLGFMRKWLWPSKVVVHNFKHWRNHSSVTKVNCLLHWATYMWELPWEGGGYFGNDVLYLYSSTLSIRLPCTIASCLPFLVAVLGTRWRSLLRRRNEDHIPVLLIPECTFLDDCKTRVATLKLKQWTVAGEKKIQ